MYVPTQPMIDSLVRSGFGGIADYTLLPFNGSYVRFPFNWNKRYLVREERRKRELRIAYRSIMEEERFFGWIEDKILVSRIMEWMECYLGKKRTNCSAFAHFLTTGSFVECPNESPRVVLEQGMCAYDGQKVRVGDMICVIFARDNWCSSRLSDLRPRYLKSKKKRREDNRFVHALLPRNETLTAEEIRDVCKVGYTDDYHFLVCVGKYNGKSVWISQRGYHEPGQDPVSVAITIGDHDGYDLDVPLLTLIKRRR